MKQFYFRCLGGAHYVRPIVELFFYLLGAAAFAAYLLR